MPYLSDAEPEEIQELVKKLIDREGTQRKAGQKLGVSQPTIHSWLKGRARPNRWHVAILRQITRSS